MTAIGKSAHTTKWLCVKDISVIWAQSQRPFDKKWAARIAEEFDPDMVGVISVTSADKNGRYHAIDGQHRVAAVKMLWGENERVPCNIFDADSPERAAEIFDTMNTSRKTPQAIDVFKVRVTAKTEPEFSVSEIIEQAGFVLTVNPIECGLSAVRACVAVFGKFGADHLLYTLVNVKQIWGGEVGSANATAVRGMAEFLARYKNEININDFRKRIAKSYTPARLLGSARQAAELYRGSVIEGAVRVLVNAYNHGVRRKRIGE